MTIKTVSHFTQIQEMLFNRCYAFPACPCGEKFAEWGEVLERWNDPDEPPPSHEDLEIARIELATALACAAMHHPEIEQRHNCAKQLMLSSVWNLTELLKDEADEAAGPHLRIVGGIDG
jgi:hypothetical protein